MLGDEAATGKREGHFPDLARGAHVRRKHQVRRKHRGGDPGHPLTPGPDSWPTARMEGRTASGSWITCSLEY